MNKKLRDAAKKVSAAYQGWIMAGAEYNSLVHEMSGVTSSNYSVTFDQIEITDKKKGKSRTTRRKRL